MKRIAAMALFSIAFLLVLPHVSLAACGEKGWEKVIGYPDTSLQPRSMVQTNDGGYVAVGTGFMNIPDSGGKQTIVKLNQSGGIEFLIDEPSESSITGYWSVTNTSDGGFAAISWPNKTYKYSSDGQLEKVYVSDNVTFSLMNPRAIEQTKDGGYIITGSYYNNNWDFFLLKLNSSLEKSWEKNLSASCGYCGGGPVAQTPDGGYVIGGTVTIDINNYYSPSKTKAIVIKTDAYGNVHWNTTIAGRLGVYSIRPTSDNGYIASLSGNGFDAIVKLDSQGNLQWRKDARDRLISTVGELNSHMGYYLIGQTNSSYYSNCQVIVLNKTGDLVWNATYDRGKPDTSCTGQETSDNGFVFSALSAKPMPDC